VIGPVAFGTSALIMLLVALGRLLWRGLRFAPVLTPLAVPSVALSQDEPVDPR
jgi:hypothetical protein